MTRCALRLGALVLVLGACAGKPAVGSGRVGRTVDAGIAVARSADASAEGGSTASSGLCPEDAPWTGSVCMGHGYLACPAGLTLEGNQCGRVGVDAGAAPKPHKTEEKTADE